MEIGMTNFHMNKLSLTTGLCLLMTGVASPAFAQTKTVMIDGSSTVFPIMEAVAEEFQKLKKSAVRVTVGISGTGGGFKKFCRGETDISNGSRPILKAELDECKKTGIEFYELPIAFDALTVAVSPKNKFIGECITVADLKKIWEPSAQGKIMSWSDVREGLPKQPIKLYGAGSDSGTFDYFTEAVTGKAKASRGDYTASEDDNVLVQGIENDVNSLGYIPFSYYAPHADKMKALAVDWGKGEGCVKPSLENVLAGKYNPLSRPLFLYVSKKSADTKPEVREFVEFTMRNAVPLIKEVKYLQLPDMAYEIGLKKFKDGKTGTIFGGVPEVGLKIEDIVSRESKS
jgi:phosphate transport system substrate-binding protein